jgi:hypothetical protein
MSDLPGGPASDERPRPTPRPRPGPAPRPSPRPRVAGSRRDRDELPGTRVASAERDPVRPVATARPGSTPSSATAPSEAHVTAAIPTASGGPATAATGGRRTFVLVVVLSLLCLAAAAGAGVLLWQRLTPGSVDSAIFAATRSGIEAVYAYDYKDSEGSVRGKLAVLTGDLRDQYEKDLTRGGIIDTYEQVSATTRYEVLDVGLKQVSKAQDTATLVVFGQYVVESVNSGSKPAPEGSGCQVTPAGAQSCTQTVRVTVVDVDGQWKISELTLLTRS